MNELKFRAYHPDSGWKYFDFTLVKAGCVMFDDGDWRPLKDCEVMLFTTRHDKNEKEIYEGDIIISPRKEKGKVVFVNSGFYAEYLPPDDWDIMCPGEPINRDMELIGNIYDNPELLNAETESK